MPAVWKPLVTVIQFSSCLSLRSLCVSVSLSIITHLTALLHARHSEAGTKKKTPLLSAINYKRVVVMVNSTHFISLWVQEKNTGDTKLETAFSSILHSVLLSEMQLVLITNSGSNWQPVWPGRVVRADRDEEKEEEKKRNKMSINK